MANITPVYLGERADDGTGDSLRNAFSKLNNNIRTLRSNITTAPRVALLGDSITGNNTALGSEKNTYHDGRGFLTWLQIRLGFPFAFDVSSDGNSNKLGDNLAVGGYRTADMLGQLPALFNRNPDIVFIMGGTNDIIDGNDFATITSNLNSIYDQLMERGIIVIALPILPRGGASDWPDSTKRLLHHRINHWIREQAYARPGMLVIDPYKDFVDPTTTNGDVRSNYTVDGLHPSIIGGYAMGEQAVLILSDILPPRRSGFYSPSDTYNATQNPCGNLLTNGALSGTSGTLGTGASGSVASNWNIYRSGGSYATATCSKTTYSDGSLGAMQQIILNATGSGSSTGSIYMAISPSSITSNITAGNWYVAECDIEVTASANGYSPLEALYLELWDTSTGGSRTRCLNSYADHYFPNKAWSGTLKTPPLQLVGTTGLRWRIVAELDESVADNITVSIGRCSLRHVLNTPSF